MRLPPILGIIWARRAVAVIPLVGCLAGATLTALTSPPRYVASARVTINYIKPDPETGIVVPSKMVEAYAETQAEFVRDYQVAGVALEALGWLDSPDLQAAYGARDPRDTRDFKVWASHGIMGSTSASMVEDSNILEIRYAAQSPELATMVVGAIRDAYMEASLQVKRAGADANADALSARVKETSERLKGLETAKAETERATGLILNEQNQDFDSARLGAMAAKIQAPIADIRSPRSPLSEQLARLESDLTVYQATLGPNHPRVRAAIKERDQLRAQVETTESSSRATADAFQANAQAQASLFEALKFKVLGQRQQALELKLLQDQIDRENEVRENLVEGLLEQRQLSTTESSALTSVGEPSRAKRSVSSNIPLILSTAALMGLVQGILLALLVEFLARHVRTSADLQAAANVPVLGVIPKSQLQRRRRKPARIKVPKPAKTRRPKLPKATNAA